MATKAKTSVAFSEHTKGQITDLAQRLGLGSGEVLTLAVDRMHQDAFVRDPAGVRPRVAIETPQDGAPHLGERDGRVWILCVREDSVSLSYVILGGRERWVVYDSIDVDRLRATVQELEDHQKRMGTDTISDALVKEIRRLL
jgi:hypothetical protein